MIKNLIFIVLFSTLIGCSQFKFVYKENPNTDELFKKIYFTTSGDDEDIIRYFLNQKTRNSVSPNYKLEINSIKNSKNLVMENDQIASVLKIEYLISYNLYNQNKSCTIYNKTLTTSSQQNSRAASYNFGSDISTKDSSKIIIKQNIDNFISELNSNKYKNKNNELLCQNEQNED